MVYAAITKPIVPSNYSNPYMTTVALEEIQVDPFTKKLNIFEARVNRVLDYRNELDGTVEEAKFVSTHLYSQDTIFRDGSSLYCPKQTIGVINICQEYVGIQFDGGSEVVIVKRVYNTATQIVGEIRGILKIVTFLVMLYSVYNNSKKINFFAEKVFNFNNKKLRKEKNRGKDTFVIASTKVAAKEGAKSSSQGGRLLKQSQSKLRKTSKSEAQNFLEKLFYQKFSNVDFIEKTNFLDFIESLVLDEDARMLLPIALLAKKRRENRAEVNQKKSEEKAEESDSGSIMQRLSNRSQFQAARSSLEKGWDSADQRIDRSPLSRSRKSEQEPKANPENLIQKIIKDYLKGQIQGISKQQQSSRRSQTGSKVGLNNANKPKSRFARFMQQRGSESIQREGISSEGHQPSIAGSEPISDSTGEVQSSLRSGMEEL